MNTVELKNSEPQLPEASPLGSTPVECIAVTLALRPGTHLPSIDELFTHPPEPIDHDTCAQRYGASQEDLSRVEDFAREHGLEVVLPRGGKGDLALHCSVTLRGTPRQLDEAFKVDLKAYAQPRSRGRMDHFYSHKDPVSLPSALKDVVTWVFGLDTRPVVGVAPRGPTSFEEGSDSVAALRSVATLRKRAGRRGTALYNAPDLAQRYSYPRDFTGRRQTIGLVELSGGCSEADLNAYFDKFPTDHPIQYVGPNEPSAEPTLADLEVTMDVEIAASASPGAKVVVYNAGSKDFSLRDFYKAFSLAIFDREHLPSVLSVSWAFMERGQIKGDEERAFEALFVRAALLGITICAASGDAGSNISTPGPGTPTGAVALPVTYYPAASPFVLGCGGTRLGEVEEVVWNELATKLRIPTTYGGSVVIESNGGSSSGGVSTLNALPPYQDHPEIEVPEIVEMEWDKGILFVKSRTRGRGVPDVAIHADLFSGYEFVLHEHWGTAGGTSASAPMWAALVARLNEGLGRRLGWLNPVLYKLELDGGGGLFRRIVRGTNGAYHAHHDLVWNPCTGLGSPNGERILKALRAHFK